MQRENNKVIIRGLKNYYCDAVMCSLKEFVNPEKYDLTQLTEDEIKTLCEFSVLKNKMAGVSELNLKVPFSGVGNEALDKYEMKGGEIVPAEEFNNLRTSSLVGERLTLEISSIDEYNQNFLSDVSDFVGLTDCKVLIKLGQDLEEVGKVVNKFKMSPAETLESFGFLDRKCFVYGLNFIDKDDQKLLKEYDTFCIFSPRDDGEEGRGAINLYNFIYNELKFGFSSGECYNIDMLGEAKLAKLNTSNLMYQNDLIDNEILLESLQSEYGKNIIDLDDFEREDNIFDKKIRIENKEYNGLREKVKIIAQNLKEKE